MQFTPGRERERKGLTGEPAMALACCCKQAYIFLLFYLVKKKTFFSFGLAKTTTGKCVRRLFLCENEFRPFFLQIERGGAKMFAVYHRRILLFLLFCKRRRYSISSVFFSPSFLSWIIAGEDKRDRKNALFANTDTRKTFELNAMKRKCLFQFSKMWNIEQNILLCFLIVYVVFTENTRFPFSKQVCERGLGGGLKRPSVRCSKTKKEKESLKCTDDGVRNPILLLARSHALVRERKKSFTPTPTPLSLPSLKVTCPAAKKMPLCAREGWSE